MAPPDWLFRPIAHRGLHDHANGIIENTPSAFAAAMAAGYAIETDLREAACGTPMVFHDERLERLTGGTGFLAEHDAAELRALHFRDTAERMPRLCDLLSQVAGRVPLFLEVKSDWTGTGRFPARIAADISGYAGPVAVMSFDPWLLRHFCTHSPKVPRGLAAKRMRADDYRSGGPFKRFALTHLLFTPIAKPHFITYDVAALPAAAPWIARRVVGLPVIAWTVRSEAEWQRASAYADTLIFEGFRPSNRQIKALSAHG